MLGKTILGKRKPTREAMTSMAAIRYQNNLARLPVRLLLMLCCLNLSVLSAKAAPFADVAESRVNYQKVIAGPSTPAVLWNR